MTGERILRMLDGLIRLTVNVLLLAVLFYGGYSLWDTCRILDGAAPERVRMLRPDQEKEEKVSFEKMLRINPDVRAWITIDGTGIDYPVVQGQDNQTYVNTDVFGDYSISGSIFLDSRNAPDFSDLCSLIYGHHMEGGRMFGALDQFLDPGFFEEHRTGKLMLPGKTYSVRWLCMAGTDAYDEQVFDLPEDRRKGQEAFVSHLFRHALYLGEDAEKYAEADRLIVLTTCKEAGSTERLLLVGAVQDGKKQERKSNENKPVFTIGGRMDPAHGTLGGSSPAVREF